MEGGLFLIFIIIAMIARAIEAMAKGKQEPPQQQPRGRPRPQQRPQQRSLQQQRAPRSDTGEPFGSRGRVQDRRPVPVRDEVPPDATEDAAAAMIPDDLWEILTGRPKPQSSRPQPAPLPAPHYEVEYEEADADEELATYDVVPDEIAEYDRRRRLQEAQRERARHELTERRRRERDLHTADKAPIVYSLERPLPAAAQRHAEFHAKVDVPAAAQQTARRRSARERLFGGDDLKRAIILQEVLGRPKGLE